MWQADCSNLFSISRTTGASLAGEWLRPCPFTVEGMGSVPGQGTEIPTAAHCGQKKKELCLETQVMRVSSENYRATSSASGGLAWDCLSPALRGRGCEKDSLEPSVEVARGTGDAEGNWSREGSRTLASSLALG